MTDIAALLKTGIYLISTSLLYPAMALLFVSFLGVVLIAGAFFAEWIERVRLDNAHPEDFPALIKEGRTNGALPHRVRHYIRRLGPLLESPPVDEMRIDNLIRTTILDMWKRLDRLRILVRVGPSLGLMGTLIPMGTGLAALGQGDMTRLSSDLVIAFTTTVVGLAVGVTAFFLYTVKRRWIEEDVKNIELATDLLTSRDEGVL